MQPTQRNRWNKKFPSLAIPRETLGCVAARESSSPKSPSRQMESIAEERARRFEEGLCRERKAHDERYEAILKEREKEKRLSKSSGSTDVVPNETSKLEYSYAVVPEMPKGKPRKREALKTGGPEQNQTAWPNAERIIKGIGNGKN